MANFRWMTLALASLAIGSLACVKQAQADAEKSPQSPLDTKSQQRLDVPYVPTPEPVVKAMLELAAPKKDEKLVDLGCGDGRIVVTAARDYGVRGVGIDLNPVRIQESNANAQKAGVQDRVQFIEGDLFKYDFKDADVLTMYLLPSVNMKLRPVILDQLRPGTRVVSHAFDMEDWKPDEERNINGKRVFFWVVPAKVGGTWNLKINDQPSTLALDQKFQEVTGSLRSGERNLNVLRPKLQGKNLSFSVRDDDEVRQISGTIEGDTFTGTSQAGNGQPTKVTGTRAAQNGG